MVTDRPEMLLEASSAVVLDVQTSHSSSLKEKQV